MKHNASKIGKFLGVIGETFSYNKHEIKKADQFEIPDHNVLCSYCMYKDLGMNDTVNDKNF